MAFLTANSGHPLPLLQVVILTPARPAVILYTPPTGGHTHSCPPSGHPLPLLQVVILNPAHTAVILYPACRWSYSLLPAQR